MLKLGAHKSLNLKDINDGRYYAWRTIKYMQIDISLTHDSEKQTSGCAFQFVLPFGLSLFPKCIIVHFKKIFYPFTIPYILLNKKDTLR